MCVCACVDALYVNCGYTVCEFVCVCVCVLMCLCMCVMCLLVYGMNSLVFVFCMSVYLYVFRCLLVCASLCVSLFPNKPNSLRVYACVSVLWVGCVCVCVCVCVSYLPQRLTETERWMVRCYLPLRPTPPSGPT